MICDVYIPKIYKLNVSWQFVIKLPSGNYHLLDYIDNMSEFDFKGVAEEDMSSLRFAGLIEFNEEDSFDMIGELLKEHFPEEFV